MKNTHAIQRGAGVAKLQIDQRQKQAQAAGVVKIDAPNRAQRRAAAKQTNRTKSPYTRPDHQE